jgi:tripartite-type tricarboxylate transporter receptor subunit TctC
LIPTTRRGFAAFAARLGAAALLPLPGLSLAQGKTLKILVGYAPGGAADTVARIVADGLRETGYTAIIENKAGAAGRLAIEALMGLPADGNTLVLMPVGGVTLYPHVVKSMRHDPLKDLVGVASASSMSFALAVGASSPARTLGDFVEMARKNKNLAAYGTPGAGTAMHFLGAMLAKDANLPLTHVAYKGGSAALTDAVSGVLPSVITTTPNLLPMHNSGKLRILAISEANPNAALPGVPTFKSAGYPDLVVAENFAFFARAGTPAATVTQLNAAITQAVQTAKVQALLRKAEYEPQTMTADALDRDVRASHARWGRVVKAAGYTPEE